MIVEINPILDDENVSEIKFNVNFGINEGKEYVFKSNEHPIIKAGRKKRSDVQLVFPEDATSRVQCL